MNEPEYSTLEKTKEFDDLPLTYQMAGMEDVLGESYACIEQGLFYDDEREVDAAIRMYDRGLNLLMEADKMEGCDSCELYHYLKESQPSVQRRMEVLKKEGMIDIKKDQSMHTIPSSLDTSFEEAELVLCIPEGVQLFSIDDESAAAPTYPSQLCIFKFAEVPSASPSFESPKPDAFIQVGPWSYPLYKGQTPILRNQFGSYVVANPTPDKPGLSVAILLPADLDPSLRADFHSILQEYSVLREAQETDKGPKGLNEEEKKRVSDRMAHFLMRGGEKISFVVQKGTLKTTSYVHHRSEKYRNVPPTDKPIVVNGTVKSGAVYVHKGSKVVAKCTRYLLDKIGDIGVAVGRKVADGARKTFGDGKGGGMVSGTITVLGGGITGVSTVWMALEDASKTLCRSIADDTVHLVKVKYGDDAAETTRHTLYGAGHTTLAAAQLWDLGPRSIAGRMARKAGIQMARDLDVSRKYAVKDDATTEKKTL